MLFFLIKKKNSDYSVNSLNLGSMELFLLMSICLFLEKPQVTSIQP